MKAVLAETATRASRHRQLPVPPSPAMLERRKRNAGGRSEALSNRRLPWCAVLLGLWAAGASGADPNDAAPIAYSRSKPSNPVSRLQSLLDQSEAKLTFEEQHGFLRSVLKHLDVDTDSQTLVFSKTSLQHTRIFPRMPRAVYFNDDVYVGWVRGGEVMEVSVADPQLGAVFYTLRQQPTQRPRFRRQTHDCLQCHNSARLDGIPAHLVRSVYPGRDGRAILRAGSFRTTHASPLSERWGGWYVTGTHGAERHMGNVVVEDPSDPTQLDREAGANLTSLKSKLNTWMYLTPHSDLVTLMILEHQTHVHNVMTFAQYHVRRALHRQAAMRQLLGETDEGLGDAARARIDHAADKLLRAMLLSNEATFDGPLTGTSGFRDRYERLGPATSDGRSLRQLDLQRRLFRHPMSPLIHTEAFAALPEPLRERFFERLLPILRGRDPDPAFAHLSANDRTAIHAILLETLPDLPAAWRQAPATQAADGE